MAELVREIVIDATPETIWPFLTESEKHADWIGSPAELDPRPGGVYRASMGGGAHPAAGTFVEVVPLEALHLDRFGDAYATAAQGRPACAQCQRVFGGNFCHTLGAHSPDWISGQQVLVLIHFGREASGEVSHLLEESQRRLQCNSADPEVGGHHALSADHFEDAKDVFALAEAIQKDRHRSDIQRVGA